jgi:hypothetical protein
MDADSGWDKMAVSYATWRHAHGFSEADAPSPTELAMRMMVQKGMMTAELTEALLATFAPEAMEAVRASTQAQSETPVPDNVQDLLDQQGAPPSASGDEDAGPPIPLAEPEV